mmetsp:Transcript_5737/g.14585  ORF Transcript_5737/g.14585 Transcript_5737/m.14585 type:complete len:80 (+) Transcript_5737:1194-1433(+)
MRGISESELIAAVHVQRKEEAHIKQRENGAFHQNTKHTRWFGSTLSAGTRLQPLCREGRILTAQVGLPDGSSPPLLLQL